MMTVKDIEQAITRLPRRERIVLGSWFADLDADSWEDEIENGHNGAGLDEYVGVESAAAEADLATASQGQKVQVHPYHPVEVDFGASFPPMSDEEFFDFCQRNDEIRIERDSDGQIIIMPPAFSETGGQNFMLTAGFGAWVKSDAGGRAFDSSTGFTLPNGAIRSPDLSWIKHERWDALGAEQRSKFAHICPDFVVELRSKSDNLKKLDAKMLEYIENGAQLGWLIDPIEKTVRVYRPGFDVSLLNHPTEVSGEPLLSGFSLRLSEIWG